MQIFYFILFSLFFLHIVTKDERDIKYPHYSQLFMPAKLGPLSLKTHFIRAAPTDFTTNENRYPTEELSEIYNKLIHGNVGLIIAGSALVNKFEKSKKGIIAIWDDESISYYKKITENVHHRNSKIVLSLVMMGMYVDPETKKTGILGPGNVKNPRFDLIEKEVTKKEINEIENNFVMGALRAKKSGFDGIEIHAAQGSFLSRFLTPYFNTRKDEYGGTLENRLRIIREIIKKIQEKCGNDFPILVKINCEDEMENGLTVDEFIEAGKILENDGIIAIEVSGNTFKDKKPEDRVYYKNQAIKLAENVKIPVILTGGVRDRASIEDIFKKSNVKFFGICRPFNKNPNFIETLK